MNRFDQKVIHMMGRWKLEMNLYLIYINDIRTVMTGLKVGTTVRDTKM